MVRGEQAALRFPRCGRLTCAFCLPIESWWLKRRLVESLRKLAAGPAWRYARYGVITLNPARYRRLDGSLQVGKAYHDLRRLVGKVLEHARQRIPGRDLKHVLIIEQSHGIPHANLIVISKTIAEEVDTTQGNIWRSGKDYGVSHGLGTAAWAFSPIESPDALGNYLGKPEQAPVDAPRGFKAVSASPGSMIPERRFRNDWMSRNHPDQVSVLVHDHPEHVEASLATDPTFKADLLAIASKQQASKRPLPKTQDTSTISSVSCLSVMPSTSTVLPITLTPSISFTDSTSCTSPTSLTSLNLVAGYKALNLLGRNNRNTERELGMPGRYGHVVIEPHARGRYHRLDPLRGELGPDWTRWCSPRAPGSDGVAVRNRSVRTEQCETENYPTEDWDRVRRKVAWHQGRRGRVTTSAVLLDEPDPDPVVDAVYRAGAGTRAARLAESSFSAPWHAPGNIDYVDPAFGPPMRSWIADVLTAERLDGISVHRSASGVRFDRRTARIAIWHRLKLERHRVEREALARLGRARVDEREAELVVGFLQLLAHVLCSRVFSPGTRRVRDALYVKTLERLLRNYATPPGQRESQVASTAATGTGPSTGSKT